MAEDCEALVARAQMLHREAELGLEAALDKGPTWTGFDQQVAIANKFDQMAQAIDEKVEEDC